MYIEHHAIAGPGSPVGSTTTISLEDDEWAQFEKRQGGPSIDGPSSGAAGSSEDGSRPPPLRRESTFVEEVAEEVRNMIPTEKIKKGGTAAVSFLSWGYSKFKEEAGKLEKTVANSELGKSIKESEAAKQAAIYSSIAGENIKSGAGKLKHNAEALKRDLIDPNLGDAKKTTADVAESMKPHLKTAKDQTTKGIHNIGSAAVKTAIWFQSMGASGFESDDNEDIPRRPPSQVVTETRPSGAQQRPTGAFEVDDMLSMPPPSDLKERDSVMSSDVLGLNTTTGSRNRDDSIFLPPVEKSDSLSGSMGVMPPTVAMAMPLPPVVPAPPAAPASSLPVPATASAPTQPPATSEPRKSKDSDDSLFDFDITTTAAATSAPPVPTSIPAVASVPPAAPASIPAVPSIPTAPAAVPLAATTPPAGAPPPPAGAPAVSATTSATPAVPVPEAPNDPSPAERKKSQDSLFDFDF